MGINSGLIKTFNEAKNMLPIDDQWTINNIWSHDQGKTVAKDVELGKATGISDGSYKNNRSTAACILEENSNKESRMYVVDTTH